MTGLPRLADLIEPGRDGHYRRFERRISSRTVLSWHVHASVHEFGSRLVSEESARRAGALPDQWRYRRAPRGEEERQESELGVTRGPLGRPGRHFAIDVGGSSLDYAASATSAPGSCGRRPRVHCRATRAGCGTRWEAL